MRRTKEEAAVTRQTLLKQALATFSRKGYAATTLEDIAQQAEVTRGAIYWHFGSKADLYNTLIDEYTGRGQAIMQQAVAEGGTLLEILRRVFVCQLEAVEEDEELKALMDLALFKTERVDELEAGRQTQIQSGIGLLDMLAKIMKDGAEQGLLRKDVDPKSLARSYLALQNGLIQLWLTAPSQFSLAEQADTFAQVLMAGIQA
ncbi:MAG: TetR family transcriptional regulator [Anaerolineales bacterium]|jgi:TetR/AcrR family acrAB operon transcriptional repressor